MTALTALALFLAGAGTGTSPAAGADDLIPAGSINGALTAPKRVYLVEDDPALIEYVTRIRDQFSPGAPLLAGEEADRDVEGAALVVYGTPEGLPWLADLEGSLPFQFDDEGLLVQGQRFRGKQLRLVCALRNPIEPERRVALYTAREPGHLIGVNGVFHGPTEWVVSEGSRTLGSGSFEITKPLSGEQARRDLAFLVDKIGSVHPAAVNGLPEGVAERAELAEEALGDTVDRDLLWSELNAVIAELRDAHSAFAPKASGARFDLPLVWLRGGLVAEHSAGALQKGDLVLSLGGRDEARLLELLAARVPAETQWWLRAQGPALLAGGFLTDALELTSDGALPVVVSRAGERVAFEVPPGAGPVRGPRRPWIFTEVGSDLAVLTLDRCTYDEEYRRMLRGFFEAVRTKGSERVVVDVRRNSGGNSMVLDEFLRYLDLDEFVSYTGAVRESEDSLAQRGGDRELGYHEFGRTVKRNTRVSGLPSFEGELTVLTSNATFSSGNWFAVVVQDNGLGEIVGEPTGNAPSSYGDILRFSLPESGFAFNLSYKRWIRPDPQRDPAECLEPDVLVPLERSDVVRGGDPAMEWLERRQRTGRAPR